MIGFSSWFYFLTAFLGCLAQKYCLFRSLSLFGRKTFSLVLVWTLILYLFLPSLFIPWPCCHISRSLSILEKIFLTLLISWFWFLYLWVSFSLSGPKFILVNECILYPVVLYQYFSLLAFKTFPDVTPQYLTKPIPYHFPVLSSTTAGLVSTKVL